MHTETITYKVPCPTPITQIGDGQFQNPVVTQIGDGQIQNPVVTQIGDGQIQNPVATQIGDGQIQNPVATQLGDGQIQNPVAPASADEQAKGPATFPTITAPAVTNTPEVVSQPASVPLVTEAVDAQPVAPLPSSSVTPPPASISVPPVTEAPDAQPVVPSISSSTTSAPISDSVAISSPISPSTPPSRVISSTSTTTGDASASRPTLGSNGLESCAKSGAFSITLEDGILKDQQGRTGYIAANYQFQFDGPPQAGAIITAGFSVCANGSLALGGSSVFYQCLSGNFYNLYDRYWAAQCSPVTIDTIKLKQC